MGLLRYIDKPNSEVKVQYMINAIRLFSLGLVDVGGYFYIGIMSNFSVN